MGAQRSTTNNKGKPPKKDKGHKPRSEDYKPKFRTAASVKQPARSPKEEITIGARVKIKNPKPRTGASILLEADTKGIVTRKS